MTATMIPFPCRRRIGKARHAATKYLEAAAYRPGCVDAYWRQVSLNLCTSMAKVGIDDETIRRELAEFRQILAAEIRRQARETPLDVTGDCA